MWFSAITAGIKFLLGNTAGIKDVAEVFFGNKKERDATAAANEYNEQIEIHKEQASGYSYAAVTRNWFDSAIDGINRLPRPAFAFLVLWLLVWPMFDPVQYAVSMKALSSVPEWVSTLITVVLVFFFGSRTIAKDIPSQAASRAESAKRLAELAPTTGEKNPVIDAWRGFTR